jgi:limonene-1,2-epoxide hydrolase
MFDLDEEGKIVSWRDYFDNETWFKNGGPRLHL